MEVAFWLDIDQEWRVYGNVGYSVLSWPFFCTPYLQQCVGADKEGLKQEWEINFNENAHICIDKIDVIPTVE